MKCVCENNARCDSVSGRCTCAPGWTGLNCRKGNSRRKLIFYLSDVSLLTLRLWWDVCVAACDAGHWGVDCGETCDCRNGDGSCDAVTGQCNCEAGYTGTLCHQSMLLFFLLKAIWGCALSQLVTGWGTWQTWLLSLAFTDWTKLVFALLPGCWLRFGSYGPVTALLHIKIKNVIRSKVFKLMYVVVESLKIFFVGKKLKYVPVKIGSVVYLPQIL